MHIHKIPFMFFVSQRACTKFLANLVTIVYTKSRTNTALGSSRARTMKKNMMLDSIEHDTSWHIHIVALSADSLAYAPSGLFGSCQIFTL